MLQPPDPDVDSDYRQCYPVVVVYLRRRDEFLDSGPGDLRRTDALPGSEFERRQMFVCFHQTDVRFRRMGGWFHRMGGWTRRMGAFLHRPSPFREIGNQAGNVEVELGTQAQLWKVPHGPLSSSSLWRRSCSKVVVLGPVEGQVGHCQGSTEMNCVVPRIHVWIWMETMVQVRECYVEAPAVLPKSYCPRLDEAQVA